MRLSRSLLDASIIVAIAVGVVLGAVAPAFADAAPGMQSSKAHVCKLMPMPGIEQLLGKPTRVDERLSLCTAEFPEGIAELLYLKPGGPGVPTDTKTMLTMLMPPSKASKGNTVITKNYGDVACLAVGMHRGSLWKTTCGDPRGYLVLSVARSGSMVSFDIMKKLLATAKGKI